MGHLAHMLRLRPSPLPLDVVSGQLLTAGAALPAPFACPVRLSVHSGHVAAEVAPRIGRDQARESRVLGWRMRYAPQAPVIQPLTQPPKPLHQADRELCDQRGDSDGAGRQPRDPPGLCHLHWYLTLPPNPEPRTPNPATRDSKPETRALNQKPSTLNPEL